MNCKGKYMSEHLKGEDNPNFKAVTVQCEYCGKDIIKPPSRVNEHNFCSQECLANSRKTGETVKCYVCGKEFYKIKSQIDRSEKHFCSEKCKCEHQTTLRGELSPQYNPNLTDEERIANRDYIEYTEWRNKVFERDNYTCQVVTVAECSITNTCNLIRNSDTCKAFATFERTHFNACNTIGNCYTF